MTRIKVILYHYSYLSTLIMDLKKEKDTTTKLCYSEKSLVSCSVTGGTTKVLSVNKTTFSQHQLGKLAT